MKFILSFFGKITDRVFVLIFALILLQTPLFISQYLNTLSGALYESEKTIKSIRKSAKKTNKTLEQFIKKHIDNADKDFHESGLNMQKQNERYKSYKTAFTELSKSSIWFKPIAFIKSLDYELFKITRLTPGIPFSLEGAIYGFIGLLLGMSFSVLF